MTVTEIDTCPYDEIDPACVRLCRVLNTQFPGLRTTECCQGFVDGHRPGHDWIVTFRIDRRARAIRTAIDSLELLTWMLNSDLRRTGSGVQVELNAPPPYLNPDALYFCVAGVADRSLHPDQVAEAIETYLRMLPDDG